MNLLSGESTRSNKLQSIESLFAHCGFFSEIKLLDIVCDTSCECDFLI